MDFGPKFKELLEKHGVSQSKFASDTETNPGLVSRYLSGRETPSADFIVKAIKYFPGTDVNYLFQDVLADRVGESVPTYAKEPDAHVIIKEIEYNLKRLKKLVPQK